MLFTCWSKACARSRKESHGSEKSAVLVLVAYGRLAEYPRPGFMVRGRLCVYVLGILISSWLGSTAASELSAAPSMSKGVRLRGFVDKWTGPLWGKPT